MRRALFILALALPATAQTMQLTGGQSSLYQATGAGLTAYLPASTLYVGAGCANRCAFGMSDRTTFHGWDLIAGDSSFGYQLDGAGLSTQVRGFNFQRTSPQQTTAFYVGSAALGYSTPFYLANQAQHIGAGLFVKRTLGPWQVGTLEEIDGGKRTAVQGATYTGHKLRASATGGLLQNARLLNATADYQPSQSLHVMAAHLNYFFPRRVVSDSLAAGGMFGRFTGQASVVHATAAGRSINGATLNTGARLGPISLQAGWYHSARTGVLTQVATAQLTRRWSVTQAITESGGHTSFSTGGAYHNNRISVSVGHSIAFLPLAHGWQQVTSIEISFHIPHTDAAVNLSTALLPTGQTKYTAYGNTWAKGPLHLQQAAQHAHTHSKTGRYLVQGTVKDRKGQPVSGAAVVLGKAMIFSNSAGAFYVRLRNAKPVPVRVVPEQFAAPGVWVVVSAPDTVQPGTPVSIVVELN
jgi:hypothetical protein